MSESALYRQDAVNLVDRAMESSHISISERYVGAAKVYALLAIAAAIEEKDEETK